MRGFYPLRWTSDYVNHSMVTNASSVPKIILAYVIAGRVIYDLAPVTLDFYATHLYDIDTLRSDQVRDIKGVRIPMSAVSGKFQWTSEKEDYVAGLQGRMEVIGKNENRASSFSCGGIAVVQLTAHPFLITPGMTIQ